MNRVLRDGGPVFAPALIFMAVLLVGLISARAQASHDALLRASAQRALLQDLVRDNEITPANARYQESRLGLPPSDWRAVWVSGLPPGWTVEPARIPDP